MSGRRNWTEEEIETLVAFYEQRQGKPMDLTSLAEALDRRKSSICRKARAMDLTDNSRQKGVPGKFVRPHQFATDEEHSAWQSDAAKKWHANNPHPRGALGMKHTEETLQKVSEASKRTWQQTTPEQREEQKAKMVQTKLEKYGTAGCRGDQPYSRCRGGKREDLGNRYFRSAWEANYARYLDLLVEKNKIESWEYEPETFRFEGVLRGPYTYTPDFRIIENDGRVVWHEVKGWMDPASRSRLKRMKKHYPLVEIVVIGAVEFKDISRIAPMIRGWEY